MAETSLQELARSIAQECLAGRIRQTGRVVSSIYEKELRPDGVTIAQFSLLVALACGLRTAKELGQRLQLEKSTVSRNLERMSELGWIEARETSDRRSAELVLTAAGRGKLRAAHPAWKRAQAACRTLLGQDALENLEGLARRLGRDR